MLHDLACPACGASGLEATQPTGAVVCKFCGHKFADDNNVACLRCETINLPEAGFCKECGEKLKRTCPACGSQNWIGAEHCATCGRNLDALEAMADRHAQGFKGTLKHQREIANLLKSEEETDSQKRLASMWQVEARRQEHLTQQQDQQRQQFTRLTMVALSLAALFACAIIVFFIWASLR